MHSTQEFIDIFLYPLNNFILLPSHAHCTVWLTASANAIECLALYTRSLFLILLSRILTSLVIMFNENCVVRLSENSGDVNV